MRKKIARSAAFLFCGMLLFGTGAYAGKANVEQYRFWAMVEKLEISQNRGETYYTVFEDIETNMEISSVTSIEVFEETNEQIPEGVYNYFKCTVTGTRWKVVYNDTVNGSAYIMPDIDDRETYEVTGPMLIEVERNQEKEIFIHFDLYKSIQDCEARWNGIGYSLEDFRFYPVISIHE